MSQTKKKLTINAVSSIIQVAFTAVLFFFLYKYLLVKLGAEQLGVWSLILSFSSIANLANLGITSGLVKFVAEYIAEHNESKIGKLILTSLMSMILFFSIICLLILFGADYFLYLLIDENYLELALSILPISLMSLSLNAISGVFTSVLEGFQKNYLRNFVYVISGVIMFVFTLILTPEYKLLGVAYAQLIQAFTVFLLSLVMMYSTSVYNRFTFWKLSKSSFKELFDYGYKFQIVSISQLLYEPTTKLLLSKFGGLALLGHYEMAAKLVSQFRALLVNANQVVVPVVAENSLIKSSNQIKSFYIKMNRTLWLFTLPLITMLIAVSPIISILWIGDVNSDFIFAIAVLSIASGVNVMCGPSYFSCMGEGKLSLLIFIHLSMAVINFVLGWLFGYYFGGYGIVLAWGLALSIGSAMLIYFYSKRIGLKYLNIFTKTDYYILIFSFLAFIASVALFLTNILVISVWSSLVFDLILLLVFLVLVFKNDGFQELLLLVKKKSL